MEICALIGFGMIVLMVVGAVKTTTAAASAVKNKLASRQPSDTIEAETLPALPVIQQPGVERVDVQRVNIPNERAAMQPKSIKHVAVEAGSKALVEGLLKAFFRSLK